MMKGIIIFIESDSIYASQKAFDGKSAVDLSYEWAKKLEMDICTISEKLSVLSALEEMFDICEKNAANYAVISFNDVPFTNLSVTRKLIENHIEYKAEYTFSDGYPYGFTPEIIDKGTLKILIGMLKNQGENKENNSPLARNFLYELIKKDINSFEVETVLSESDWRLFRFSFCTEKKENFIACKELYEKIISKSENELTADKIVEKASMLPSILKTVPGFYNLQICSYEEKSIYSPYYNEYKNKYSENPSKEKCSFMKFEAIKKLIKEISELSENAVVSLSAFGEAFCHPQIIEIIEEIIKYKGLCVFIETNGLLINQEIAEKLAELYKKYPSQKNFFEKIMIAVKLDSFSKETYNIIHPESCETDFETAVTAINLLKNALPGCVYPQFVRMQQNEEELEKFFRYWNENNSGKLIIQKYDDYAGLLPQYKVADLSPLERNVCWHIRRDMTVLINGDVPVCHSCIFSDCVGNVFENSLDSVWKKLDDFVVQHINGNYCQKCRNCDEYYTFNF